MIITDIVEMSKNKVEVCVDDEIRFALYKNELRKFGITKGSELSRETYDTIMGEVLLKRAKLRCMNLLKGRDYTKHQLVTKLKQGRYPEEIIETAVAYVCSYGYADDARYAKSYIECAGQSRSRRQMERDLARRGISAEIIRQACEECMEEDSIAGEEELIQKFLDKKHFNRQNATDRECQKLVGFLYRKGFGLDKIYRAIGHDRDWVME